MARSALRRRRPLAQMADRKPIGFGYNPPTEDRQIERVDPATFVRDLGHVLDVARKSLDSLWVSDHHMTADRYRLECWTQLTWIAARYPGPLLGTRRGPARVQIAPYRYTAWISARV